MLFGECCVGVVYDGACFGACLCMTGFGQGVNISSDGVQLPGYAECCVGCSGQWVFACGVVLLVHGSGFLYLTAL